MKLVYAFSFLLMILTYSNTPQLNSLFLKTDAGKILGQPAVLSDSSTTSHSNAVTYSCAYAATSIDPVTGKLGNIYFLIEKFSTSERAHTKYISTKSANENHDGIKVLDSLGDEAYFHSDASNFCFIMLRKKNYVVTMKVNKLTSFTSLPEFHTTAMRIAKEL